MYTGLIIQVIKDENACCFIELDMTKGVSLFIDNIGFNSLELACLSLDI